MISGQGGAGKTALAVELAHWLVRSNRFDRCAFVSMETYLHERAALDTLGKQLVESDYSVADYGDDLEKALQPIIRTLENDRCLLVLDNLESLMTDAGNIKPMLALFEHLLPTGKEATRLLFTTRESLPEPFAHQPLEIELGPLTRTDAQALVIQIMRYKGLDLKHDDQGNNTDEVNALVDSVGCHARALVLLAQEMSSEGVTSTTGHLRQIMRKLEEQHSGNRELSLFASVELSLQRLSPELREQVVGLAMFHNGGDLTAMAHVLDVTIEQIRSICSDLIKVGLATELDYSYIRLDPALPAYLDLQLEPQQRTAYNTRWMEAMQDLVIFLSKRRFEDVCLVSKITQLALPNLMAYIEDLSGTEKSEPVEVAILSYQAVRIENLLSHLNRPQALAKVVEIREHAGKGLEEWSEARFSNESQKINHLLKQNAIQPAYEAAQRLLSQCQRASEQSYEGADYDLATAHFLLGNTLSIGGAAEQALEYLEQAQSRFEQLGKKGTAMASSALAVQGKCLRELMQLDASEAALNKAIEYNQKLNDQHSVAMIKVELATLWMIQRRYDEALQIYREILKLFNQLNEPTSVAYIWHMRGMIYQEIGDYPQAEQAYRKSLTMRIQLDERSGEASSLNELGRLYNAWKRPEQAVDFARQSADIYTQIDDKRSEGFARGNLASLLIHLQRLEEARPELWRAIECLRTFGHSAKLWNAWDLLFRLERASGNQQAARDAKKQQIQEFLAYRRDGGESQFGMASKFCPAVFQGIKEDKRDEIWHTIWQFLPEGDHEYLRVLLTKLGAIIDGERDPALAQDENLKFYESAEILLLLEQLQGEGL